MRRRGRRSGGSIRAAARGARTRFRHRGVTVHADRVFVTYRNFLFALDRQTGQPIAVVRRRRPHRSCARVSAGRPKRLSVSASTPGVVFEDLLILPSQRARDAAGHAGPHPRVRREDRQAALDLPHHSAAGRVRLRHVADGRATRCPAAPMPGRASPSIAKLGMVFAATGSASFDFYGVNRHGDNLFANCVLALDARTGKRVWHFQAVKHDVWDWDLPGAAEPRHRDAQRPRDRRRRADHQVRLRLRARSPDRRVALPDRGSPRRRHRRSTASRLAATQPHPLKPPPFARQRPDRSDADDARTPEAHAAVLARFRKLQVGRLFTPPSLEGTIVFPGVRRRRRVGRRGVRSGIRAAATSTRTRCRGSCS